MQNGWVSSGGDLEGPITYMTKELCKVYLQMREGAASAVLHTWFNSSLVGTGKAVAGRRRLVSKPAEKHCRSHDFGEKTE